MAKIIVANACKQIALQITQGLETAGIEVFRACATAGEVIRAFNICDDGVLICGARFQDMTADQLAWDLGSRALILVVGKPEQLELCEHPDIYKLQAPFSMRELAACVNMLLQTHYKRLPHRTHDEKDLIDRAKALLMREKGMTEKEAHTFLQKESMRRGIKMTDRARELLSERTGE